MSVAGFQNNQTAFCEFIPVIYPPNSGPGLAPGRYRHFKGNHYLVLGEARHSETEAPLVIYRPLYGERGLWARPRALFLAPTATGAVRFEYVGDDRS